MRKIDVLKDHMVYVHYNAIKTPTSRKLFIKSGNTTVTKLILYAYNTICVIVSFKTLISFHTFTYCL